MRLRREKRVTVLAVTSGGVGIRVISPLSTSFRALPTACLLASDFPLAGGSRGGNFEGLTVRLRNGENLTVRIVFAPLGWMACC